MNTTLAPAALDLPAVLQAAGIPAEALPGEAPEQHLDRLDTALMAHFRDTGRQEAFDALYRNSHHRVWVWLRWMIHEQRARLDAGELLQDTFVNVYRYASSFRSEHAGSFRVWVRTIAANVVRRAKAVAARLRTVSCEDPDHLAVESDERTPHLHASHREERAGLRGACALLLHHYLAALERLSPRDRRALELVELEGRSYAETGAILGVGPSNMKMIMLRARRRLIAHLRASLGALELAVAA